MEPEHVAAQIIAPPSNAPGTLHVVSMPIGNPDDISLRSLQVLRRVSCIAAENVEVSRRLLEHWGVNGSLVRSSGQSNAPVTASLIARLAAGQDVALICDAGTPGIADPGARLIRTVLSHEIPVVACPGPTAALVALTISGLPTQRFAFDGFPPRTCADRAVFFRRLAEEDRTILLYESAAYLRATLDALYCALSSHRRIAIACRLTQPDETWVRGTLDEAVLHFRRKRPRGEYTLVVAGKT